MNYSGVLFMKKRYYKENSLGALTKLALGTGISILSIIVFSVIFGALAMLFQNINSMIPLFSMTTVIASAITSGIIISRLISNGNIGLSTLIFLLSWLLLMLVGVIINKGVLPLSVFLNFIIFVGVASLSSYLFKKRDRRMKRSFTR